MLDKDALELIKQDFDLSNLSEFTETGIIQHLADQIAYMMDQEPDLLFSYFYRMDISEVKVREILTLEQSEPVNILLAKLVWARQLQRAFTKKQYGQSKGDPYALD